MAVTRARRDPQTRDYIAPKKAEGKTHRDATRCLERHLARRVWNLPRTPPRSDTKHSHHQFTTALTLIDAHDAQLAPLDQDLREYARRQPGCRALMRHYGIGPVTAVTILAELGDARRFGSSREAVRYSGLDITVHQSDARRAPGRLSRQGPSALRWALFEAAQCARRSGSPDHHYYLRRRPRGSVATAPAWPWRASCSSAAITPFGNSARRRWRPHDRRSARAALDHADASRPAPGMLLPPRPRGRPS
jgi:transposase